MDILALIDRIEELVDSGRNVPFTGGKMVDPEKIYELIDEIRAQFPDELKQARWIVKERQEMLEEAEKEANRVLEEAKSRAEAMAADMEIVKMAEQQAAAILEPIPELLISHHGSDKDCAMRVHCIKRRYAEIQGTLRVDLGSHEATKGPPKSRRSTCHAACYT